MLIRDYIETSEYGFGIYLDPSDARIIYLNDERDYSLADLQKIIETHWKGCDLSKISISSISLRTKGCGCHSEPSDYEALIKIELLGS